MKEEWPAWRLWVEKRVRLRELDEEYSIVDVQKANEVLDAWHRAERLAAKRRDK